MFFTLMTTWPPWEIASYNKKKLKSLYLHIIFLEYFNNQTLKSPLLFNLLSLKTKKYFFYIPVLLSQVNVYDELSYI